MTDSVHKLVTDTKLRVDKVDARILHAVVQSNERLRIELEKRRVVSFAVGLILGLLIGLVL